VLVATDVSIWSEKFAARRFYGSEPSSAVKTDHPRSKRSLRNYDTIPQSRHFVDDLTHCATF